MYLLHQLDNLTVNNNTIIDIASAVSKSFLWQCVQFGTHFLMTACLVNCLAHLVD